MMIIIFHSNPFFISAQFFLASIFGIRAPSRGLLNIGATVFSNPKMARESSFVQPTVPKFDGHWAMLMENFLRSKEYWRLVENGLPTTAKGEVLTDAQKKTFDEQTISKIR